MKFIKLNECEDVYEIWISLHHLQAFQRSSFSNGGALVQVTDFPEGMFVDETPEQILALIEEATHSEKDQTT